MIIQEVPSTKSGRAVLRWVLKFAGWLAVVVLGLGLAGAALVLIADHGGFGDRIQRRVQLEIIRHRFNRIYSLSNPPFEQGPNAFMVKATTSLPKGEALAIACGQGRNAVYLAQEGWKVTAFDISDKGLEIALRTAARDGLGLTAIRASAEEFDYGRNRWDLVLLVYAPIPYDDAGLMSRIMDSVKPGGYILAEDPIEMHQPPEKRPRIPGDLLPGELPKLFPGFEILSYEETVAVSDFFREKKLIGRLLARKPANLESNVAKPVSAVGRSSRGARSPGAARSADSRGPSTPLRNVAQRSL